MKLFYILFPLDGLPASSSSTFSAMTSCTLGGLFVKELDSEKLELPSSLGSSKSRFANYWSSNLTVDSFMLIGVEADSFFTDGGNLIPLALDLFDPTGFWTPFMLDLNILLEKRVLVLMRMDALLFAIFLGLGEFIGLL